MGDVSGIFSRMLVAIDGSEPSKESLRVAARLAREHGGTLVLCHVVDWVPLVAEVDAAGGGMTGIAMDARPIIDSLETQGKAMLSHAAERVKAFGVPFQERQIDGEAAENILRVAEELECSLIVMGTHGREGVARFFVGSTTESVLRASTIPVLTIRSGERLPQEGRRSFERVLVGIDRSSPSQAATERILLEPELHHVFFLSVAHGDLAKERAQALVDSAVGAARARKIEADGTVRDGDPIQTLIHAAKRGNADLIVVGSHGRQGIRRFFLGSVAEGVLREAPVPVLVIRT